VLLFVCVIFLHANGLFWSLLYVLLLKQKSFRNFFYYSSHCAPLFFTYMCVYDCLCVYTLFYFCPHVSFFFIGFFESLLLIFNRILICSVYVSISSKKNSNINQQKSTALQFFWFIFTFAYRTLTLISSSSTCVINFGVSIEHTYQQMPTCDVLYRTILYVEQKPTCVYFDQKIKQHNRPRPARGLLLLLIW